MSTYSAWLGAGALTIGLGAAALACSAAASADAGTGTSARHNVSTTHSAGPTAHSAPRPKPSAALIAASTVTGVADRKPTSAAAITKPATASSAPPIAHKNLLPPSLVDVLGRLVMLGSAIQTFDVGAAVHDAEQAVSAAAHNAVQTVVNAVQTVVGGVGSVVATALFIVALPIEIPIGLYTLNWLIHSPLWM
ncbi:hypothetical protein [Mycolicibacterium pallens]|uniref:Transmembrane protein n=1 Tax=Mycolicibacterium pallens TaxID=370524 RepID=A0ABX8VCF3_9MYCO|nr:hypothetical protein [Mycolicibacterium pallens]QYL15474.1 hypothetical protein K0O64_20505 [Mycolicibacterium pallens]